MKRYALSLKQPWATLLVHGLKSIEVRSWPTARRGPILIHAARVPDHRPEAWAKLPLELHSTARLLGGIIGQGELTNCVQYMTPEEFAADRKQHLNDPSWFQPPKLYGFKFTDLKPTAFRRYSGWMRFFPVEIEDEPLCCDPLKREIPAHVVDSLAGGWGLPSGVNHTRLLVSVRSVAEAVAALEGGADVIDIKEPAHGSLGRADDAIISAIVDAVGGRKPVSAACGELLEDLPIPKTEPITFVKWGLAGCGPLDDWPSRMAKAVARLPDQCRPVAVAYADWQRAKAPPPDEVGRLVRSARWGALLIDTWEKDARSLLDFLSLAEIGRIVRQGHAAGIPVALAGSLEWAAIESLLPLLPALIALRGAVCRGGNRKNEIDRGRVRRLAALLAQNAYEGSLADASS